MLCSILNVFYLIQIIQQTQIFPCLCKLKYVVSLPDNFEGEDDFSHRLVSSPAIKNFPNINFLYYRNNLHIFEAFICELLSSQFYQKQVSKSCAKFTAFLKCLETALVKAGNQWVDSSAELMNAVRGFYYYRQEQ